MSRESGKASLWGPQVLCQQQGQSCWIYNGMKNRDDFWKYSCNFDLCHRNPDGHSKSEEGKNLINSRRASWIRQSCLHFLFRRVVPEEYWGVTRSPLGNSQCLLGLSTALPDCHRLFTYFLSPVIISRNLPQYLKSWTSWVQSQRCFSTPVIVLWAPVSFTCWLPTYKCVTLVPLSNDRMLEMCHLCQVPADWAAKYCTQLPYYYGWYKIVLCILNN